MGREGTNHKVKGFIKRRLSLPIFVILLLLIFHTSGTLLWLHQNTLPDGYQNEILHLGYLLDFYSSLKKGLKFGDWYDFKYYFLTGYWPPLFYLSAFPSLIVAGVGKNQATMTSLIYLLILLVSTYLCARDLFGKRAAIYSTIFISFLPSIYGNLRRFEPNIALISLFALFFYLLVRSRGISRTNFVFLSGVVGGFGLLVDRVSFILFFSFSIIYFFVKGIIDQYRFSGKFSYVVRGPLLNTLLLIAIVSAISFPYYKNFYKLYREEVFSQISKGEIDERGNVTSFHPPFSLASLLYYPLSLFDSQAGPFPGFLILLSMLHFIRERKEPHIPVLLVFILPIIVLILITKKQSFYSIPLLFPCSLMVGDFLSSIQKGGARCLLSSLLIFVLLNQYLMTSYGKGLSAIPSSLPFHERNQEKGSSMIDPFYPQSSPPIHHDLKVSTLLEEIESLKKSGAIDGIGVYSEYHGFHERYLNFFIATRNLDLPVKGLVMDPSSFFEWFNNLTIFVYVSEYSGRNWPSSWTIEKTLRNYSYTAGVESYIEKFPSLAKCFELKRSLTIEENGGIFIYLRKRSAAECPSL